MKNSCSGQIIAPLLLLLIPAVVLLGISFQSGRATLTRIKLQTEVDCVTASVAAWITNGLNETAKANSLVKTFDSLSREAVGGKKSLYEAEIRRLQRVKVDLMIKTIEEAYKEVDESCAAVIQFPLSDKGLLDTSLLRITVCKAVGKASAFASKKIITVANVDGSEILSSDFNPQWCKVEFNSEVFDIIHSKYPAAIEGWSKERINDEILH